MFRLIRAAFNQRRKTLLNGFRNDAGLKLSKERVEEALTACGLPLAVRGETLGLQEYAALADYFLLHP